MKLDINGEAIEAPVPRDTPLLWVIREEAGPSSIAGIALAAGASRRLGRPKQLVEPAGEALVHVAARVPSRGRLPPLELVTALGKASILRKVAS